MKLRLVKKEPYHHGGKDLTAGYIETNTLQAHESVGPSEICQVLNALMNMDISAPDGIEVFMTVVLNQSGNESLEACGAEKKIGYLWLRNVEQGTVVPVTAVYLSALSKLLAKGGQKAMAGFIAKRIEESLPDVLKRLKKDRVESDGLDQKDKRINLAFRVLSLMENGGRLSEK